MLTNLHVKNLALIEEADVNLTEGLNILTGETGAGKSIIIGSINYCLGEKVNHEVIRSGAEYALIELIFTVDEELSKKLRSMDFELEDDTIILQRKIYPNRSVLKVCGETVTAKQMKELASYLIDIHGQHEHQSLLSKKSQGDILDEFCGEELSEIKKQLSKEYSEYNAIKEKIDALSIDDSLRKREISLAEYEIGEIEAAALTVGEEEELRATFKKMQNASKTMEALSAASLNFKDGNANVLNLLGYAIKDISSVTDVDDEIRNIYDKAVDAEAILSEICRDIDGYMNDLDFSREDYDNACNRLDVINTLTSKYGGSVEKVLEYLEARRETLEELTDAEGNINRLNKEAEDVKERILVLCKKAHDIRVITSKQLSSDIENVLKELNFLKVGFEIKVDTKEQFGTSGFDDITFMISLNPGENMMPIAEVASGGELSRIMLALKTVFARKDQIGTLIFDEIDAGISGQTAWKVSERMHEISKHHQVIAITHLPQIAAMADSHYMIEKGESEGTTVTSIYELDADGSISELSRLLGGGMITDAARQNAIELMDMAAKVKKE